MERRCRILMAVIGMTAVGLIVGPRVALGNSLNNVFRQHYDEWLVWRYEALTKLTLNPDTDPYVIFECQAFQEIVQLGPPAIPSIMKELQRDHALGYALHKISKFGWHEKRLGDGPKRIWVVEEFADIVCEKGPPDSRVLWFRWWSEGEELVPRLFKQRYQNWKRATEEGQSAEHEIQRLKDLGIQSLPLIVGKLAQGETGLVPVFSYLVDGAVEDKAEPSECVQWWDKNKERFTVPKPSEEDARLWEHFLAP